MSPRSPIAPADGAVLAGEGPRLGSAGAYAAALLLVAAANLAAAAWGPALGGNLSMLFLVSVLIAAVGLGLGPALAAAVAAAITYNFFFLEPRLTFEIRRPADLLTFLTFFVVALVTGWLAGRARDHTRHVARRNAIIGSLLEASRTLSAANTPDEAAEALAGQLAAASGGAAVVLLPGADDLRVAGGPRGLTQLAAASVAAARRAWESGQAAASAGAGAEADWTFQALRGLHGRVGVVGLRTAPPAPGSEAEDRLSALLEQGAAAIERAQLAAAAAENAGLRKADQLRSALLNSISHDFRTPLSTVLGAATTLLAYETQLKPAVRRDLLESIREEGERINRYVGDLLDMSRLEGGALSPRREWTDVRDVLGSAIARVKAQGRAIERAFSAEVALVRLDPVLLEQAILNLLENAAAYSPAGSRILVTAVDGDGEVRVAVEDEGPGIPPEAQAMVFDRFRRLQTPSDRTQGLGLGLSIAKGFIEAMGGRIAAISPIGPEGGTRMEISLPRAEPAAEAEA
jgi:two-component system sensor histidine kinase KdpD